MTTSRKSSATAASVATYRADPLYPRAARAVEALLARGTVVAPVDVLVSIDFLTADQLRAWRRGQVPYLERVINCNLTRLSRLLRILRFIAHDLNLKPSSTVYLRRGKGGRLPLRFTKSGDPKLEHAYSTHFVWTGNGPFHRPASRDAAVVSDVPVDLSVLRRELQALPRGALLLVAQQAIELLPDAALPTLLGDVVQIEHGLQATAQTLNLLDEVREFGASSMSGRFHDSSNGNWRDCTQQSRGTDGFIAEFNRLLGRCVRHADAVAGAMARESFELLFGLLRHIDEGLDDVVFFADEGGSWCIGVDWRKALPAYFRCLASNASTEDFARSVDRVIRDFVEHDRGRFLGDARRLASAAQQACLNALAIPRD